jgi:small subunit ribosomal protein S9
MAEKKTYYTGTGRRKTAVARVRVSDGKGVISINGRPLDQYFTEEKDRAAAVVPLVATDLRNRIDVSVKVHGGGITGQADAIKQGVARAVKTMFAPPNERKTYSFGGTTVIRGYKDQKATKAAAMAAMSAPTAVATPAAGAAPATEDPTIGLVKKLRDGGYLTRDSRMKERKKYGLRGARRGTQFSKR